MTTSQQYIDSIIDILQPIHTNYMEPIISLDNIHEMLDKLPQDVWYNPNLKWLDPNCNLSQFLVCVFQRLMKGLEKTFPNPKERRKHIVSNMLFVSEIYPKNLEIYKKIMIKDDPGNETSVNIIPSFMETDSKFDIILGYPPNEDKKYLNYIKKSLEVLSQNGFLLFLTPNLVLEHITLVYKDYIDELYQIKHISSNLNFKQNYIYFLLEKEPYSYPTTIEYFFENKFHTYNIPLVSGYRIPRIISDIDLSIIRKITSQEDFYEINNFIFENNKTQRIKKDLIQKSVIKERPDPDYKIRIIDNIGKGMPFPGKFYYFNKKDTDYDRDKVVFSRKGQMMAHISPKNQYTYSHNFSYVKDDILNDLYSILMLFDSIIIKYLDYQFSKNENDCTAALKNIKKLNKPVKNVNDLFKIYNLSSIEIQRIKLISTLK